MNMQFLRMGIHTNEPHLTWATAPLLWPPRPFPVTRCKIGVILFNHILNKIWWKWLGSPGMDSASGQRLQPVQVEKSSTPVRLNEATHVYCIPMTCPGCISWQAASAVIVILQLYRSWDNFEKNLSFSQKYEMFVKHLKIHSQKSIPNSKMCRS